MDDILICSCFILLHDLVNVPELAHEYMKRGVSYTHDTLNIPQPHPSTGECFASPPGGYKQAVILDNRLQARG
jgi:hypothetical protein